MQNPRLADRYAKSIIDIAIEKGKLDSVYQDMLSIVAMCKESPDLRQLINSPIFSNETKIRCLKKIATASGLLSLTFDYIELLVKKGRVQFLQEIAQAYIDHYYIINNIHKVKLTTASEISDSLRESIIEKIRKERNVVLVELESLVDPNLIGGFTLEFDGKFLDASISRTLRDLREQFSGYDFKNRMN